MNKNLFVYFLLIILVINNIIKRIYKYKQRHNSLIEHLIAYRSKSRGQYYYSLIIVLNFIISLFTIVIYLRVNAMEKPLNTRQIYDNLYTFYTNIGF